MSLLRVINAVPNATTITPLSPELCMNSSNSAGSGLDGLVRSGPTTLVSKKDVNQSVTQANLKKIGFSQKSNLNDLLHTGQTLYH